VPIRYAREKDYKSFANGSPSLPGDATGEISEDLATEALDVDTSDDIGRQDFYDDRQLRDR
jgi:hypothetical protein